ncbi:MAG: hypothetical protein DRR11_02210 [Gammaproteobacteria bacterium]|nr:MAG: hypothetical protein DRR11_02210 [Gammaproteobacteria bacterium]RLA36365.1 MAG: hypothetical protein DRR15_05175 [Gammaproteobacteria bacterium]
MNEGADETTDWSRDTQKLAVLTWISFLTASGFTMLFFAFVDPLVLVDALNITAIESRNAGYAIGFALFFANTWIAGWFTLRLCRRKRTGPVSLPRKD